MPGRGWVCTEETSELRRRLEERLHSNHATRPVCTQIHVGLQGVEEAALLASLHRIRISTVREQRNEGASYQMGHRSCAFRVHLCKKAQSEIQQQIHFSDEPQSIYLAWVQEKRRHRQYFYRGKPRPLKGYRATVQRGRGARTVENFKLTQTVRIQIITISSAKNQFT